MSTLRFNDGVNIATDGPYRIVRLSDGYYVVGHGMCCPENSLEEAEKTLEYFKKEEKNAAGSNL